jgi:hypothetical protein
MASAANYRIQHAQTPYYGEILSKEAQNQNRGAFPIAKLEDEEKAEQPFQDHTTDGRPLNRRSIVGAGRSFEMATVISYTAGVKPRRF